VSLWRKRKISDTVTTDVHHNEQNPSDLVNILTNLSIKSKDLSMQSKIWVDPPEGWKFGFPAIYDPDTDGQMSEWIVNKGYPVQIIKEYGESWAVRCWPAEEPH
jgi:hypothetical protein